MGIPYLDIHFNLFMKTKWVILVNGKDCLGTIPSNILEVSLKVSLVFISIPLRIKFVFLNSSAVRSYTKHLRERERELTAALSTNSQDSVFRYKFPW